MFCEWVKLAKSVGLALLELKYSEVAKATQVHNSSTFVQRQNPSFRHYRHLSRWHLLSDLTKVPVTLQMFLYKSGKCTMKENSKEAIAHIYTHTHTLLHKQKGIIYLYRRACISSTTLKNVPILTWLSCSWLTGVQSDVSFWFRSSSILSFGMMCVLGCTTDVKSYCNLSVSPKQSDLTFLCLINKSLPP